MSELLESSIDDNCGRLNCKYLTLSIPTTQPLVQKCIAMCFEIVFS